MTASDAIRWARRVRSERPPAALDEYLAGFESFFNDYAGRVDHWRTRNPGYHESIASLARFYVPRGTRVLEVGCGTGDSSTPMDPKAMRFLNLLGNRFFGLLLSVLLGQPIKDTLCGTKVIGAGLQAARRGPSHFGDFDPFGDFDLIFGAARLNLRILEIPVRYRDRVYGETTSAAAPTAGCSFACPRWRRGASSSRHERCRDPGAAPRRVAGAPRAPRGVPRVVRAAAGGGRRPPPGGRGRLRPRLLQGARAVRSSPPTSSRASPSTSAATPTSCPSARPAWGPS